MSNGLSELKTNAIIYSTSVDIVCIVRDDVVFQNGKSTSISGWIILNSQSSLRLLDDADTINHTWDSTCYCCEKSEVRAAGSSISGENHVVIRLAGN